MASRNVDIVLKANITGYMASLATASQATGQFATGLHAGAVKGGQGFTALSTGALAVGAAAAAGLGLAVSKFAEFDQAMSQVEAATMASAGEMDLLRQAAIDMGASTVFTAREAAEGIENLAKAGISTADILGGALAGSLDLAAAGELEVGDAAEIAATAMTQFNIAGSEVPHIADLLAAAAGKAQGEVTDMAAALNQSGIVASQMGLSIEETTGTLAAFASAGLIGSDAGTSFRTMLLRLANPSQEAAGLMEDLGISAYDAQGNFVGMEDLAGQLRDKLSGLTQAQRDSTLATIFGSDAIRAANVLYNQGAGGIESWIEKVDDSGYAAEQAAKKTDNLVGDLERLGGAFDSALIQSGSIANDTLRFLAKTATDLVDSFASMPAPLQAVVVGGLALAAAVGLLGGAYGLAAPKIAAANAALIATGPAGAAASRGLGLAAKAAGVLAVAWIALDLGGSKFREWTGDVVATGGDASGVLLEIAASGEISKTSMEELGASTATFDQAMQQAFGRDAFDNVVGFFREVGSLKGALPWGDDEVDEANRFFESVDAGLSSMVAAGRTGEAAAVFDIIAERAALSGASIEDIKRALPGFTAAVEQSMDAANKALEEAVASGSAEDLAAAINSAQLAIELGGLSAEEAAAKFPMLAGAIQLLALIAPDLSNQMNGVAISVLDTGLSAEQAAYRLDAMKLAMDRLTGGAITANQAQANFTLALEAMGNALLANGTSFDVNTVAGANNYNSLVSVRSAAQDSAIAAYELAAATGDGAAGYDAFTGSLEASRIALYNTLIDMGLTAEEAKRLTDEVLSIPTVAEIDAILNENGVGAALDYIARPRTAYVNTVNRVSTEYSLNTGQRDGGYLQGYAGGGVIRGAGTGRSDSILARASNGNRSYLSVSNGEFITNAADTSRNRAALEAGNQGAKLMIAPGYHGGGIVGGRTMPATRDWDALRQQLAAIAERQINLTSVLNLDGRVAARVVNLVNERNGAR